METFVSNVYSPTTAYTVHLDQVQRRRIGLMSIMLAYE